MKKIAIISDLGKSAGLGHFSRAKMIKKDLKKYFKKKIILKEIYITGKKLSFLRKDKYFILKKENFFENLYMYLNQFEPNFIILNLSKNFETKYSIRLISILKKINSRIVAIDGFVNYYNILYKIWLPNFYIPKKLRYKKKILYGWDKLFVEKIQKNIKKFKKRVLVLIGGTDKYNLTSNLPNLINKNLKDYEIFWIKGPFSKNPKFKKDNNKWKIIKNKFNINKEISMAGIAIVLFGKSFFEVASKSIPSVVIIPPGKEEIGLSKVLKNKDFSVVKNPVSALNLMKKMIKDKKRYMDIANKNSNLFKPQNKKNFYNKLFGF